MSTPAERGPSVAIYCRVIDNLGDAAFCWRLARQLASEFGCAVELVIDQPSIVDLLIDGHLGARPPAGAARIERLPSAGHPDARVTIRPWRDDDELQSRPDLIIAAYGCDLPSRERARLGRDAPNPKPAWINLEYLSAEPWIDGVHGLPSIKPHDLATEVFFMPGFTSRSGGLLRERWVDQRIRAAHEPARRREPLSAWGVPSAASPQERLVSLFGYDLPVIDELLHAIAADSTPWHVLIPHGVATRALSSCVGRPLAPGETLVLGQARLTGLSWLTQLDYDLLLGACDLNLVRGEDSWIRAIWAGLPLLWQPYPQREAAHLGKLRAFLDRLDPPPGTSAGAAARAMMLALGGEGDIAAAWPAFASAVRDGTLGGVVGELRAGLLAQSDLASRLMDWLRARRQQEPLEQPPRQA